MNFVLIGSIAGGVLGILGGVIGTYISIKNTRGPLERGVVIKFSVIVWIAISIFLGLIFLTPNSFRNFLWIAYVVLLPVGISLMNRELSNARKIENVVGDGSKLDLSQV